MSDLLNIKLGGSKRLVKFLPIVPTVTIGGRKYPTVKLGNQLWLAENLDYSDENIPVVTYSYNQYSSRAIYYLNDGETYGYNGLKYGLLYTAYAIDFINNIAPSGWRVPTIADYNALISNVGTNSTAALSVIRGDFGGTDTTGLGIPLIGEYSNGTFREFNTQSGIYSSDYSGVNYPRLKVSASTIGTEKNGNVVGRIFRSIRLVKDVT